MVKKLQQHIDKIRKFERDRIFWLRLSGFVVLSILLIIIDLSFFKIEPVHWVLVSVGLVISVSWWYWTMKLVREILNHRLTEIDILSSIVKDLEEIKKDIKK